VTRELRVLALAGSLRREGGEAEETFTRRVLGWLIRGPNEDFDDAIADDALRHGPRDRRRPAGPPGISPAQYARRARRGDLGRAPIWNGDEVAGAVVVEESTNPILSVRSQALERLLVLTLAAFAVAAAVLIWFATRISARIRRLRDEARNGDRRARALAHPHSRLTDRAGRGRRDRRSVRAASRRCSASSRSTHAYLESLASRLSHELRTPIAVVRSSLEKTLSRAGRRARLHRPRRKRPKRLGTNSHAP